MPTTRLGWFTLYMGGTGLLLVLLEVLLLRLGAAGAADTLDPWVRFLAFVFFIFFVFLTLRWFRNYAMWWLRNRLIVTYLFIGGVPIILLLLMVFLSAYFLASQFAAFLTVSGLQPPLQRLLAANAAITSQIQDQPLDHLTAGKFKYDDPGMPGLKVTIMPESERPSWLKDGFHGVVRDDANLYLRAVKFAGSGNKKFSVVAGVPLDKHYLGEMAADLGSVTVYENRGNASFDSDAENGIVVPGGKVPSISTGTLPPAGQWWDYGLGYYALIQATDWKTGETRNADFLVGTVRLSTLYSRLPISVSRQTALVGVGLAVLAVLFGLIVLIALFIGFRLTRTITLSVANMYEGTQHINRGDFRHRIPVRQRDQLGELQVAFNSMTESVEKLIAEQKEKERLQSELAIAQEVQAQLFPTALSSTETLELFGICRPARIVSGDYYDFLSYGQEQIGVAVGDISGKGISAALLMASIHSAVRAYEHEQLVAVKTRAERLAEADLPAGSVALAIRHAPPQSPSQVLWLLNRHLHKTTQPEKYATLFLGFYDGLSRTMTYSNAGHLPPLILGADGSIRRLETGGTVVGLFDAVDYEEATVELNPGDIFVAFSDGITEPENEFGEFGETRLIETIQLYRHLPLERITENVIAAVQDWIGSTEQPDDITLVLARPRG